jgi:predicted O-linked N-acetylglucosamine transferase (SPINDLY family)
VSTLAELMSSATGLHQQGQLARAEQIYRQVLALEPSHAPAAFQWGVLCLQAGQPDRALALLQQAIRGDGGQATYHLNLAEALRRLGQMPAAKQSLRRATELQPELVAAWANWGSLCLETGELDSAISCFTAAVARAPSDLQLRSLLGRALLLAERHGDALQCFQAAVQLAPHDATANYNLGAVLQSAGHLAEAEQAYRAAIARQPNHALAHGNLGSVLQQLGAETEAERHYQLALEINPNLHSAHNNLAALYISWYRAEDALRHCEAAARLAPQTPDVLGNMANAQASVGQMAEAVANYRRALAVAPDHAKLHGDLLYLLNYLPESSPESLFREHCQWGAAHADPLTRQALPHAMVDAPQRRLRIGYVSPYFTEHAVNYFVEPILSCHDHQRCEIFAYSDVRVATATTLRLKGYCDHWRDTAGLTDAQLAQAVRGDGIDVLVDLTGHIGGSRLLAFARRPAPVQVTYIGYQNTTGMRAMDYRLTDAYADPPGMTEAWHTEQLFRLNDTFFCYLPTTTAPQVQPLPATQNGYVTFGSFNNVQKIHPGVWEAWANILSRVPGSRLAVIVPPAPALMVRVRQHFASRGIDPARLALVSRLPRDEYLRAISAVDIALDPFPFNGHTTTCDCLWQGVPVVTLSGQSYVSRFGGSGLLSLGLADWIASSTEEYEAIAVGKATQLEALAALRDQLRPRMAASPLLDHARFVRQLEDAYRQMWHAKRAANSGVAPSAS